MAASQEGRRPRRVKETLAQGIAHLRQSVRTEAPRARRYGIALVLTILAALATHALDPLVPGQPFDLILAAVALATWYGGLGPGLLATATGALAVGYLLGGRVFSLFPLRPRLLLDDALFALVALLISSLHARQFEARRRAEVARERAEAALRARDEVLAVVSHDLKNPVTAIKGRAELLERQLTRGEPLDPSALSRSLGQIGMTTTRMLRLIDELIDLARLQMGEALPLAPQRMDLVEVARQAVAEYAPTSEEHRVTLRAAIARLEGVWDARRLEQVLANLLSNALKYSPKGGHVEVELEQEDGAAGRWAVVRVRDQGIGIPAEDLPHIFERFRRASNVGRIPGTGIGLSTIQEIVRQHGGTLHVESRAGAGTVFTVRLPLDDAAQAIEPRGPGAGAWPVARATIETLPQPVHQRSVTPDSLR